ncbi:conserved phage C-terminal domain-containing protein [Pendulispora brunnea]|uniref:Conserved phage C-terminal domain-containing protein n=1 Tax=Pendulispora brunnea TaxID=2905690 RepID=A0ABZ2KPI1_9BACT
MARIRTLKPELLEDAVTAGLSHGAFRLFVGCILLADDYGNLRADPRRLRGEVFWGSDATGPTEVTRLLGELSEAGRAGPQSGLVQLYTVRGQLYAHIRNWEKHQKVDHPGRPRCPSPNDPETEEYSPNSQSSRDLREPLGGFSQSRGSHFAHHRDEPAHAVDRLLAEGEEKTEQFSLSGESSRDLREGLGGASESSESASTHSVVQSGNAAEAASTASDEKSEEFSPNSESSRDVREALAPDMDQYPDQGIGINTSALPPAGSDEPAPIPESSSPKTEEPRPHRPTNSQATLPFAQPTPAASSSHERAVFDHWLTGWRKNVGGIREPKLDPKRRGRIKARLREGFTVDELKRAIDGLWSSDWHLGQNETGKRYVDIELVCRDTSHVERFLEMTRSEPSAPSARVTRISEPDPSEFVPPPAGFREALEAIATRMSATRPAGSVVKADPERGADVRWSSKREPRVESGHAG